MRQLPVLVGCLGNVFIPLLLFSFVKARKKGHVPWLAAFCVFLGLSIGPVLLVGGKVVTLYGQPVVTPYLLLQKLIPGLFAGVWTYRFLYGAILSLSLLVASELALYLGRLPALSRHFFLLLFCAASFSALFQPAALPCPVRLTSVEVPMIYRLIAAEKDDFAIMEFPDQLEGLDPHLLPTQWYFQKLSTYQLVHRKKMGNSCSRFPNLQARSSLFFTDCLRFIDSSQAGSGGRSAGVEWFRANNFKYFIVHEDFIPRRTVQELMAYVTENLGPPVFSDDDIAVFSFRPRGSRAR